MDKETSFDLRIQTVQMLPPVKAENSGTKRIPTVPDQLHDDLVVKESFLRRKAYKNTTINTGESFFDDSDLNSEYYLVVVYDRTTDTALLSFRYFFDKTLISKCLRGDNNEDIKPAIPGKNFNPEDYPDRNVFLADRLSGNTNSLLYRRHRSKIFALVYSEIEKKRTDCVVLLMVRKAKRDRQLSKYLNMGFVLIGSTLHKGREHSIILRDLKNG